MSLRLAAKPPVPCEGKGIIVLPDRSSYFIKVNIAIGHEYHQLKKKKNTVS